MTSCSQKAKQPRESTSITFKLCGANEAQRSLRPNERLVSRFHMTVL